MKHLKTDYLHISILDTRTVLVKAIDGIEIDLKKSKYVNELIESEMPGDYGMIIDREADYSIVPVEVYKVLNSIKKLKAIAVVVHRKRSAFPISVEQALFNGQLEAFQSIDEARAWLAQVLG